MNIKEVVLNKLCLGCGLCTYDEKMDKLLYSKKRGIKEPSLNRNSSYSDANAVCPGKGYDIIKEGEALFPSAKYNVETGRIDALFASRSLNESVLKKASSGGVMTQIVIYLLEKKVVDKVAVAKFEYGEEGPIAKTILTNNIDEILECQGSKYCPVDVSAFIKESKNFKGKIAFIGTPCQVASIRQIQKVDGAFKEKIVYTIANFCGGFKSFNNVIKLAKRHGVNYNKINYLRFRGGGQPGSLLLTDTNKNYYEAPYPSYSAYTGYSKMLRCHFCVDAMGELADIACGDAWIDRFKNDEHSWSVIITRSEKATALINDLAFEEKICNEDISLEEVCKSQHQNLVSKKVRQSARYKLYRLLGYKLPDFDGGYNEIISPIKTEIEVFLRHKLFLLLENIGLYPLFRIIIRKKY